MEMWIIADTVKFQTGKTGMQGDPQEGRRISSFEDVIDQRV
jgi:hypothetical protein